MEEDLEIFRVSSFNLAHFLSKNPEKVKKVEEQLRTALRVNGAVGCQECGPKQYKRIMKRLQAEGFGLYKGTGEYGQFSTPMLWDKDKYEVVNTRSFKLSPELKIPLGAGPPLIKPKWAHVVTIRINGRYVNWINLHGFASVWARPRWFWVKRYFSKVAEITEDLRGLVVIQGDMNTQFSSKWMKPLRDVGFSSLQEKFGPVVTHPPKGVIDDVIWRGGPFRIRPVALEATNSVSDHHIVTGIFTITHRKR